MTTLFVSYSTADSAHATTLKKALERRGYEGIFVAHEDLKIGQDWREALFHRLRVARAVIVLWSQNARASRWCHSEIAIARFQGKPVLPIRLDGTALDQILEPWQAVPVGGDVDPYSALWLALDREGVSAQDSFHWDSNMNPYPGFEAFDEDRAGVYFGREAAIHDLHDWLPRTRAPQTSKLILIIGPSGAGKSSLLRAGLLPRLKKNPSQWLVVDPLRPGVDPLAELARTLVHAFGQQGERRSASAVAEALATVGTTNQLARELALAANTPRATVVVAIDQLEDLFQTEDANIDRFASFLAAVERAKAPGLVIMATLRTDALSSLQGRAPFRELPPRPFMIGLMPQSHLPSIIEEPARRVGVTLEPELVRQILADAPHEDGLPLIAFALQTMFASRGASRTLKVDPHYKAIGGLRGVVAKVVDGLKRDGAQKDDGSLRAAFSKLVALNDAHQFVRRKSAWSDMPSGAWATLDRFAARRLLTKDGEGASATVEVSHESIFEVWEELRSWLVEDRAFHLWAKRFHDFRRLSGGA